MKIKNLQLNILGRGAKVCTVTITIITEGFEKVTKTYFSHKLLVLSKHFSTCYLPDK